MKTWSHIVAALAFSAIALDAASAQVNAGAPNVGQGNCLPFGCAVGHNQVQQIYASSLFSGPFSITSITFYNSIGTGTFAKGEFALYLSTTSADPTAPANDPATNVTGTEQLFANLSSPGGMATPGTITFTGPAFLYTPSMGNLLLDIEFAPYGFNFSPSYLDAYRSPDVGRTTDVSGFLGSDTRGSYGLVTTFGGAAVVATPEPATFALLGLGLAAMVPVARRRTRR